MINKMCSNKGVDVITKNVHVSWRASLLAPAHVFSLYHSAALTLSEKLQLAAGSQ